jgi:heat shock protein HslJ
MFTRILFLTSLFCLTLMLSACSGASSQPSLETTAWVLTEIQGKPVLPGIFPTLRFEKGQVGGYASCNQFAGTYHASGDRLTFGYLNSTLMACLTQLTARTTDSPIMQQEEAYLAALKAVVKYQIVAGKLNLLDPMGKVVLSFETQDTRLEGKTWRLTHYSAGKDTVRPALETAPVTAEFVNGTLSGSSGCNHYSGQYTREGLKLSLGPVAATLMACADPAVMEQENDFFKALSSVDSYRMEGKKLTLYNAAGVSVAEFLP